jgi:sulfite reductase subunit B
MKSLESAFTPSPARVERVEQLTEREKKFTLSFKTPHTPGQFLMAGVAGYGESPISISSPPGENIELCIRAVGNVTRAIHRLKRGDTLWIRGPYGRGFPLERLKSKDILFIAGGTGLIPMRSLIKTVLKERKDYGALTLLYGIKSPEEFLFKEEMEGWRRSGLDARITVDRAHPGWKGHVGVVTTLTGGVGVREDRTAAVVIGPPVMYKYVVLSLGDKRLRGEDIFLSFERRMKCGVGKCGHCQINSVYTCAEGPVFTLSEIRHLPEAL